MFEKIFKLSQNETTPQREILAGITTFLTMAYIVFVQPAVLSTDFSGQPTGLDFGAVLLATCLITALTTIFMGLYANYPIALAPGMGENFFFVSVIMMLTARGVANAWQVALGIVFISGVLFVILSALNVRKALLQAISPSLRNGIAVGIGLFIAFIGFQNGHFILAKPGTMVGLNTEVLSPEMIIFSFGLLVTSILRARQIKGNVLLGILMTSMLALWMGEIQFNGVFGFPDIKTSIAFRLNIVTALKLTFWPFIAVFLFMDLFDTLGTLMGVAETADFIEDGQLPRAHKVLMVDSLGTVGGACLGTSTVTSYIESITGIVSGGRTGLASVTTGLLFLAALFFGPLVNMIGQYPAITAPALVIVGTMMMRNVKKIDWEDASESIPAFLVMVGIPFCFSISDGLALGFISYSLIKVFSGRGKEAHWLMHVMAVILLLYFIFIRAQLAQ